MIHSNSHGKIPIPTRTSLLTEHCWDVDAEEGKVNYVQ